jgi:hypothetical protein
MPSTISALFATLAQQWARRNLQLLQMRSILRERGRIGPSLFLDTVKYVIYHAIAIVPKLHLSIFLFNIGLAFFLFTIYKSVAVVILVSVVLFGVVVLHVDGPSVSRPLLPISHAAVQHIMVCMACSRLCRSVLFRLILKLLHALLIVCDTGYIESGARIQAKLVEWLINKTALRRRKQRLRDGFRGIIIEGKRCA